MDSLGSLRKEIERLRARQQAMGVQLSTTTQIAQAASGEEKRFRIAGFITTSLLTNVSGTVTWSSPMPSDTYAVDATCPALASMPSYTISNRTASGCTVTFTAPVTLAIGTLVVVVGVSPAAS